MSYREVAAQISAHTDAQTWPAAHARNLVRYAEHVLESVERGDIMQTLYALHDVGEAASYIAGDVIEKAGKETKIPAKRLADALGIPPSTLRGLRS